MTSHAVFNVSPLPKVLTRSALCLLAACLAMCLAPGEKAYAASSDPWNAWCYIALTSDETSMTDGVSFDVNTTGISTSKDLRLSTSVVNSSGGGASWNTVNLYTHAQMITSQLYRASYALTPDDMIRLGFHEGTYTIRAELEYFNSYQSAWFKTNRPLAEHTIYITEDGRFVDVNEDTAHTEDILWLAEMGISEGWVYSDGSTWFKPYADVKRADMAAFLYRMAGSPNYTPTDEELAKFTDVSNETAHAKEIWWLASQGISEGWADGTFRPYESIKRADMAAFLYRFAGKPEYTPADEDRIKFADVEDETDHSMAIWWLASQGISEGWVESDGTKAFRPYLDIKRADMAAFLHRLYSLT